ncbi:MAG: DUF438 domain-containing protein [Bacteroidales bacterium]
MSELINNSAERKKRLKELILRLHEGETEEKVRQDLLTTLSNIPYGEVVEVEQELISEGLPEDEVLRLCDAHSSVLYGSVDLSAAKKIPEGHPADVLINENRELRRVVSEIENLVSAISYGNGPVKEDEIFRLIGLFNSLWDVDKHYQRKEYLIFPYLEKQGITGPPKVMWGKHDEIRELIKGSIELLRSGGITREELTAAAEIILLPAARGVKEMTTKEEEILLPMSMDNLTEADWYAIHRQSLEIGYCLYDPKVAWKPGWAQEETLQEMKRDCRQRATAIRKLYS